MRPKRGDTVWFNVGGYGDRGLVLEVKDVRMDCVDGSHMHGRAKREGWRISEIFGGRVYVYCPCIRALWYDGTQKTKRPQPWKRSKRALYAFGENSSDKDSWFPMEFLKVE
jgi:hypothetical protein